MLKLTEIFAQLFIERFVLKLTEILAQLFVEGFVLFPYIIMSYICFCKFTEYMITEDLIRKQFVHETMKAGINQIYDTQQQVVDTHLKEHTGLLKSFVFSRPFQETESMTGKIYYIRILPYLRFLDMQYRRRNDRIAKSNRAKYALYNRVVWGVLFKETFPELTDGFTNEVRARIHNELQSALNNNNNE